MEGVLDLVYNLQCGDDSWLVAISGISLTFLKAEEELGEKKKQTCTFLTQQWSQSLYFSRSHVYLKTSLKSKKSITQRQGNEARYS